MPGQIFICYRRDDAAYVTGHINDRLCETFGAESIFTDVDNIALGVDFRAILDEMVGQCQILLAVIGDDWLTAKNQDGEFRLQDPADFVRIEIESALQRNIPVIPLLVGGTKMPSKEELPDSLQDLAFRNGTPIRPAPDFHADIDRLIASLKKHLQPETAGIPLRSIAEPERQDASESESANIDHDHEENRREVPDAIVRLEDDEKARKQTELTRERTKKRRTAFASRTLLVVLLLAIAAGSWYIDFEYQETFQETIATLTGTQTPATDEEAQFSADAAEAGSGDEAEAEAPTDAETAPGPIAAEPPEAEAVTIDLLQEVPAETDGGIAEAQPQADAIADAEVDALPDAQADSDPIAEAKFEGDAAVQSEPDTAAAVQPETEVTAEAPEVDATIAAAQREAEAAAAAQRAAEAAEAQRRLDASAALREGISLAGLGDHAAAIQSFDEAIRLNAEPAFVYKQRGASYNALGDHAAAVRDYGEAIQLNTEDANAYYNRGAANHALGNYEAAIGDFDEAIRLNGEDPDAYDSRAAAYEALGNSEAAERDLAAAAELRSGRVDPD